MINESNMALAVDFKGQSSLVGWWASEKLNGCRAVWDGENFWTREGRIIDCPDWFKQSLPDFPLDGEIHAGRGHGFGNNNSAYKVAMTAVVHGGKWFFEGDGIEPIRFTAFDLLDRSVAFIPPATTADGAMLRHVKIESPKHLVEYMMALRRDGAEGAMFRNPDEIGYHPGRTGSLLRWKFEE